MTEEQKRQFNDYLVRCLEAAADTASNYGHEQAQILNTTARTIGRGNEQAQESLYALGGLSEGAGGEARRMIKEVIRQVEINERNRQLSIEE